MVLFGEAVESFAQQFSAEQKQTEAIKHILPQQTPLLLPPLRQPQSFHLLITEGARLCRPPPLQSLQSHFVFFLFLRWLLRVERYS